jgi:hypothetical protein
LVSFELECIVAGPQGSATIPVGGFPTVPLSGTAIIILSIPEVIVLQVLQDATCQTLTVGGALIRVGEFRKGHGSVALRVL